MLARLFVIFGGLLVLALTLALVGPYFVDWTSYRADFEREASAILGRNVTVQGHATARLLPFPSVTFTDVAVGGGQNGEPAMTVEEFSMDSELAPFMRGEFLIFDMRLVRPKMTVAVDGDGKIDWAVRPSSPLNPSQISIEKLTITEGQVKIRHAASGRDHMLTEINTEVSAKALDGPWRVDGSLRLDGIRTGIGLSTGKVDEKGSMRLRVRAEPMVYPIAVETDGDVHLDHGAAQYAGTFRIEAREAKAKGTAENKAAGGAAPAEPAKAEPPAWRVRGKLDLDHQRLAFDEFRFETGPLNDPYTADGSAFLAFTAESRFEVKATGAQVQFDDAVMPDKKPAGLTLKDRVAALRTALMELPRPTIPGLIDVDLPAVVAGDTTIRDVKLQAEPAPDGWNLKALSAALPGRTALEVSGLLRSDEDHFGFNGSMLLAVGQPSGFAAWLSKDVDEAIRRLPAAGFNAKVDLTEQRQLFSNLELILGKAKFHGDIENSSPADANPSMRVALTGDALDVEGLAAFSSLFVSNTGGERFADRDLDINLKAGPVSANGLTADSIDTALRVHEGDLEIDRLSIGGLAGATVSATGKVTSFADRPQGNIDVSVISVDLAPMIEQLAGQFPRNPLLTELDKRAKSYARLFKDTEIDLVGTAARNDDGSNGVAISANGKAGGTAFTLTASGSGALDAIDNAPMKLSFSAENDESGPLMALYGLPALPLQLAGSAQSTLTAEGTLASGLKTKLDFTGEDMQTTFDGTLKMVDGLGSAKGAVSIEAADLEPWLMMTGLSFPGMGYGTPVSLKADIDYDKRLLVMSKIEGVVADGPVSGDINAEMKEGVPHLSGDLAVAALDLQPVAAMVVGEAALHPAANGWPSTPFQPKAALPFTADLDLSFSSVSAGLFGQIEDAHVQAAVLPDGIRFSDLTGKLDGGALTGLLEAKNNDGSALVSTQFKLAGADLGQLFEGSGLSGQGDLTASLTATGKSVEALFASLSGSGTATLEKLEIPHINADAFPALLAGADKIGRDIDAKRTAAFAPPIVSSGTLAAPTVEVAFSLAAGVLRAPPVTLDTGKAKISSDLKVDFTTRQIAATGSVTFSAGDEALVGSDPSVGFTVEGPLAALSGRYDTEALAQFLTQRALEREQARVEALQASLIEKQRLRREVRYYASLQFERDRAAEAQRRAEEEARRAAEERRKAEEAARAAAAQAAEEAAKAAVEEEAKRRADEAARAEDAAKAAADEARRQQEAEARRRVEEEKRKAEEQQKIKAGSETDVANDAAKQKSDGKSDIERAPLPPLQAPSQPALKPFNPDAISDILKSLDN
ncbi:AsmA family protein [Mesorhizobium sp. BAC0120]|uniref:AsmA family protein n=1 Tax=Mesorhizobium sp. BAC0120 TaxID=3090670 RepID=UPI00298C4EF6|nr:AsmA family protein [Mesorhizobium sp. BAC0120]MDW6020713.1 AsmA family protein [Mesorhizobium sp. BAC0120]